MGWWTHNTVYRWCIIELYPWNLYNFINQCHPNKFNKKEKMCNSIIFIKFTEVHNLHPSPVRKHISHPNKIPHSHLQWKPSHPQTQDSAHLLSISTDSPSLVNFIPCQLNEKNAEANSFRFFRKHGLSVPVWPPHAAAELPTWLHASVVFGIELECCHIG